MIKLNNQTSVKSEMLIIKPVYEVYEAFVNPEITTRFWFTKSNGRLDVGKHVRWDWEMYGVWDVVHVKELETNKRIVIESSDGSTIEWIFNARSENETFVTINVSGFKGNEEDIFNQCLDNKEGYTIVLCGLKAYLEHNIILNLVADHAPDALVKASTFGGI